MTHFQIRHTTEFTHERLVYEIVLADDESVEGRQLTESALIDIREKVASQIERNQLQ